MAKWLACGLPFYLSSLLSEMKGVHEKRGREYHPPIFQHEFLRRTGIPHIVHPKVVAIIVVAMQLLLGGLRYLTTSLMISSQFVYFFLDDFVLHLSTITSKKNYFLIIFIETDQSELLIWSS